MLSKKHPSTAASGSNHPANLLSKCSSEAAKNICRFMIQLALNTLDGKPIAEGALEKVSAHSNSIQIYELYAVVLKIIKSTIHLPPSAVKAHTLKDSLRESMFPEEVMTDFVNVLLGPKREVLLHKLSLSKYYPKLTRLRWRVDITISSSLLKFRPVPTPGHHPAWRTLNESEIISTGSTDTVLQKSSAPAIPNASAVNIEEAASVIKCNETKDNICKTSLHAKLWPAGNSFFLKKAKICQKMMAKTEKHIRKRPELATVPHSLLLSSEAASAVESLHGLESDAGNFLLNLIRIDILSRVFEPSICAEMILSNGEVIVFEVSIVKFHELRYSVATVLKEMEVLSNRRLIKGPS